MMKKQLFGAAVLAAVLAAGALTACSGNAKGTTAAETTEAETTAAETTAADSTAAEGAPAGGETTVAETAAPAGDLKKLVVGASPTPHAEILNAAKDILASRGYALEVVEYTDYVQPNNALESGDLDANYFQHKPYLDSFNEHNGTHLVSAGAIHYEPFGIYAGKTASLDKLPEKATVLVPNDVSNEARALLLLEGQGLIKLKDGAGLEATKNDIVENPKKLDLVELDPAQIPRSLPDADIAVINGNYAIQAGLKVSDALASEDPNSLAAATYGNIVAVREGDESKDATKALLEALTSPQIKQFIEDTYKGAVVPLF